MKNTQKKFLSAVLAASSVAGVVAPAVTAFAATTTEVETFVANAKKDMNFYSWNVAYGAILSLPADQQGKYLAQIAPLEATVKTEKIKTILTKIDEFYKTSNVSVYDEIVYKLIPEVATQQDKDYLASELSKYGKPFYENSQPEYPKATDAIIAIDKAVAAGDLVKAKALIADAEAAIAKVTHVANNTYLKAALNEVITRNKLNEVALGVSKVTANTAKSFVVKFNRAVTDADKITFDVTRLTTAVTVTTTWNADKTEATLTSASNFAEAAFAVSVKSDTKEIAKENVTISAQKVAKVEFTSKSVAVTLGASPVGYVTFKAYDQYNNDITTSYLANNVTFQSGAQVGNGLIPAKNGLLTITAANNVSLLSLQNISIVAYDNNAGLSTTATLPVTTASGTLSSFTLGSVDNVKLVDGDVTSVYYIPFTAKDLSGNETKDYNLVKSGLILGTGAHLDELTTSLPGNVQAKLVQDPSDSRNAAIEVKVLNGTPVVMDMPVTIMAMTFNGTSTVQTTLTMAKKIASITLLAPAETVAAGESPTIGFEAYDQFGNKLTRYADIYGSAQNPKVNFTNVTPVKNVDGTLKLVMSPLGQKGVQTISAVVGATAKMSNLNINVQDSAKPARIAVDASKIVTAMEDLATQSFGLNGKGVKLYDQYDREMSGDNINAALSGGTNYKVIVSNTTGAVDINTAGTNTVDITSNTYPTIVAGAANGGSDTIKFELKDVNAGKILSTGSASIAVIKTSDIVDYTISTFTAPIYAAGTTTAQQQAYAANPSVYGKTNSGAKVLLAGSPVKSTSIVNTTDFGVVAASGAYNAAKIGANVLPVTKTTADTVATVNIFHNNVVTALTTNITSSSVAPVAKSIVAKNTTDDKININLGAFNALTGTSLTEWAQNGSAANKAPFYFEVSDTAYGKHGMRPDKYYINKTTAGSSTLTVDPQGLLTAGTAQVGDVFYVTAITDNGLLKTVEVTVVADTIAPAISSVTVANVGTDDVINAGDTITVTFNEATTGAAITNASLAISGGHTLDLANAGSAVWSNGNTVLTITLGTTPTLAAGDTISFAAVNTVEDTSFNDFGTATIYTVPTTLVGSAW